MEFHDLRHSSSAFLINYLYKGFKRYCEKFLEPYHLTNGLYFYLIYINRYTGCSLHQLSQAVNVTRGHTTRVIYRLEQLGYVRKESDDMDNRACKLFLTPQGDQVLLQIKGLFSTWDEDVKAGMPQEDYQTLLRLLNTAAQIKKDSPCPSPDNSI